MEIPCLSLIHSPHAPAGLSSGHLHIRCSVWRRTGQDKGQGALLSDDSNGWMDGWMVIDVKSDNPNPDTKLSCTDMRSFKVTAMAMDDGH